MLQSETFKKINTKKNTSINRTTSNSSNDYMQTNKSDFLPSDQFILKF